MEKIYNALHRLIVAYSSKIVSKPAQPCGLTAPTDNECICLGMHDAHKHKHTHTQLQLHKLVMDGLTFLSLVIWLTEHIQSCAQCNPKYVNHRLAKEFPTSNMGTRNIASALVSSSTMQCFNWSHHVSCTCLLPLQVRFSCHFFCSLLYF